MSHQFSKSAHSFVKRCKKKSKDIGSLNIPKDIGSLNIPKDIGSLNTQIEPHINQIRKPIQEIKINSILDDQKEKTPQKYYVRSKDGQKKSFLDFQSAVEHSRKTKSTLIFSKQKRNLPSESFTDTIVELCDNVVLDLSGIVLHKTKIFGSGILTGTFAASDSLISVDQISGSLNAINTTIEVNEISGVLSLADTGRLVARKISCEKIEIRGPWDLQVDSMCSRIYCCDAKFSLIVNEITCKINKTSEDENLAMKMFNDETLNSVLLPLAPIQIYNGGIDLKISTWETSGYLISAVKSDLNITAKKLVGDIINIARDTNTNKFNIESYSGTLITDVKQTEGKFGKMNSIIYLGGTSSLEINELVSPSIFLRGSHLFSGQTWDITSVLYSEGSLVTNIKSMNVNQILCGNKFVHHGNDLKVNYCFSNESEISIKTDSIISDSSTYTFVGNKVHYEFYVKELKSDFLFKLGESSLTVKAEKIITKHFGYINYCTVNIESKEMIMNNVVESSIIESNFFFLVDSFVSDSLNYVFYIEKSKGSFVGKYIIENGTLFYSDDESLVELE